MIKDRPYDRAVEVVVITPDGENALNVQELAERAWRSPSKSVTIGKVTVKVRGVRPLIRRRSSEETGKT